MEDDEPDYDPLKESLTFFEGLFNPFERLFSLFGVDFSFYWCVVRDAKVNCKKKWSREILRAKRERKEGLPSKPKRLNNTLLSHCKKKINWPMLGALTTRCQHSRYVCRLAESLKIEKQIKEFELRP